MSRLAEEVLIRLLTHDDSLSYLAKEGLDPEVLPTSGLRPVVQWALTYARQCGCSPTPAVMQERWGDLLSDREIVVSDEAPPDEGVEWAVADLKADFVRATGNTFGVRLAKTLAKVAREDRVDAFATMAAEMAAIAMRLQPGRTMVDMRQSALAMLAEYDEVAASGNPVRGMMFGLPAIDAYTKGIRPGEMAVVQAPSKAGKSFLVDWVAYKEWERGRGQMLVTLENSIEMTQHRIACMACHLSVEDLQNGTLPPEDYDRLKTWVHDVMVPCETPLIIASPQELMRNPHMIVQQARALEAESLLVDQLPLLNMGEEGGQRRHQPRHEMLYEIAYTLHTLISAGSHPISCGLVNQINREGVKAAEKDGELKSYHGAGTSGTEHAADWLFGLYATPDQKVTRQITLQTLASRRAAPRSWDLNWAPEVGCISVHAEVAA